jgi:FkbM family methyltransferase
MSYLSNAISNFLEFSSEFGVGAALRIFRNNRSAGVLKSLQVKNYSQPFYYRQATTDLPILRLIIGRELVYKPSNAPELIVDAGSNVGYVSVFYAKHFPLAEVHSIEMESSNYEMLLKNCSGYPNIKPVKAALWNHSNGISFSSNSKADAYSVVDNKTPDQKAASVTLSDILMSAKKDVIDLLKLDIEGAEVEILNWMRDTNTQPHVLMIELHDRFRPGCSEALENYLRGRKYVRSKIYEYEIIEFS